MTTSWKDAPLIALDLEGTGAQDRENEAILEIALVPINGGRPALASAYTTLISPGRPIPRRPWISPGLTTQALADAPSIEDITPALASRLDGKTIVGHNINMDWRLLSRHCPGIHAATLIDTLQLARRTQPGRKGNSLTKLLDRHQLTETVSHLAPASQPHRALWDTIGTALLLAALISDMPGDDDLSLAELQRIAGVPASPTAPSSAQATLLEM